MNIKKCAIIVLCTVMILSCTSCKKAGSDASSSYLISSNSPQINSDLIGSDSTSGNTSSTASTPSQNTLTSSKDETGSSNSSQNKINYEEKYGFSSLKSVEYNCLKDIPGSDAQYEVVRIVTNKGSAITYMGEIICKEKGISIDGLKITVPYEYRKNHDSIKLTAKHRPTDMSCDFTIKFDKWELVFEDNFDGTTLNTDVWNVWDEKRDWRYSYSKDNMFLDGKGNLVNRMSVLNSPDSVTGESKTSGAITTQDKFETTYGYFEVRMIPHRAAGLMGAFWLMAGDMGDKDAKDDGTAVNGCEIDIIETFYHNLNPSQTIHWDGYTHTKTKSFNKQNSPEIFDGKYHTFSLFWTPEEYVFLIDGEVNARTSDMGICNQPGYLLISSHFNNDAGELPITAGEHTDMIVDYVKVYSMKS